RFAGCRLVRACAGWCLPLPLRPAHALRGRPIGGSQQLHRRALPVRIRPAKRAPGTGGRSDEWLRFKRDRTFSRSSAVMQVVVDDNQPIPTSATRGNRPMTTKDLLDTYYTGIKRKSGWDSTIADDFQFIGGNNMSKPDPLVGKAAYQELINRF